MPQPISKKNKSELYFYRPEGYTESVLNGKKVYRDSSMPLGAWKGLPSGIDRLLGHIQIRLGESRMMIMHNLSIESASVSRCRSGRIKDIPYAWLVRMADYAGLTLAELRAIGGLKTYTPRLPNP